MFLFNPGSILANKKPCHLFRRLLLRIFVDRYRELDKCAGNSKKEKAKSDRILTACMRRFQSIMKEKLQNNFDYY